MVIAHGARVASQCSRLLPALLVATLTTAQIWQPWQQIPQPGVGLNSYVSMAFDSARARIVMLNDWRTWEYAGARWQLVPAVITPAGPLAYDAARARTVLFASGETWEYQGTAWTRILTVTPPPPRSGQALAYDPVRARTVLFGGMDLSGVRLADTWEYDGSNWTPIATANAPPARSDPALAWDGSRGRILLFGGDDQNGVALADTWEYDGSNWTRVATANVPPARSHTVLAHDSRRGRTVLQGGVAGVNVLGDTWEFDGQDWTPVPVSPPGIRWGHAMAFDAARGRCVLFGGFQSPAGGSFLAELWEYDGTTWQLGLPGPGVLAYDTQRERLYLFQYGITWFADGAGWHRVANAAPPGFTGHRDHRSDIVFDSARGRFVTFALASPPETWTFDGSTWVLQTPAVSPPYRSSFGFAYDTARARTVLFGGTDGARHFNDTWEFDGSNWLQVVTANSPSARQNAPLAFDSRRGRTVLFGGSNTAWLDDTWEYDGVDWTQIFTPIRPYARGQHALAYDVARGRVLLTGGFSSNGSAGDALDYDGVTWTLSGFVGGHGRYGHWMVYDSQRMRMVLGFGRWVYAGGGPPVTLGYYQGLMELPPPGSATWTRYGLGCAGSAGTPRLDAAAGALPALGTTFPLQVTSLPAQPGAVYLAFGWTITQWNGVALPIELQGLGLPACKLWIAPEPGAGPLLLHTGNSVTLPLVLPNVPALAGLRVGAQALVFDAAAPNGLGAVSNAGIAILH